MKLPFFAFLLFVSALAFASVKPAMNWGFHAADSSLIPPAVTAQQKFIYRLDLESYTTAKSSGYAQLLSLENFPSTAKEDIRLCQAAGIEECAIRFVPERGTAFLDRSGDAVWTNCHMVHGWFAYRTQQLRLAGVNESRYLDEILRSEIPLTLTDTQGKIVATGGRPVAFKALSLNSPANLECSTDDDAIKLQLRAPLATAGVARGSFAPGSTLYVGGFPRETKSRAARGVTDSNGKDFFWAFGAHLPKKDLEIFSPSSSLMVASPYVEAVLADGVEGQSGSPVLNEAGEVVGIYKGFLPLDKQTRDTPKFSVMFANLRFVEIFAELFAK